MIKIDTSSFVPIYEQVKNQIKRQIGLGICKSNQMLPSIRDMATELLINPNTVARAYRELEREGFIYTRKGKGCFVADLSTAMLEEERCVLLNQIFDEAIEEGLKFDISHEQLRKIFRERLSSVNKKKEMTQNE
ncbi:GntR family transcriptional regulator [Acidobacteriota bacterium]